MKENGELKKLHASVLTTQEGFETERSGLAGGGGFRFSGAGAPFPVLVASNRTVAGELVVPNISAIVWCSA